MNQKTGQDSIRSQSIKNKSRKKTVVTMITNICFHLLGPLDTLSNLSFTSKQYLKPWLDVHCIFITASIKSEMKTNNTPGLNMGHSLSIFKVLEGLSHTRQRIIITKKAMKAILELIGATLPLIYGSLERLRRNAGSWARGRGGLEVEWSDISALLFLMSRELLSRVFRISRTKSRL